MRNQAIRKRFGAIDDDAAARPRRRGRAFGGAAGRWAARATALVVVAALSACAGATRGPDGGVARDAPPQPPTLIERRAGGLGPDGTPRAGGPGLGAPVDFNAPVTIALLAPVGAADPGVAAAGRALADAAELALQDAGDPLLRLTLFDTRGEPAQAAAAARAAASEGAALIIGPLFSQSTASAAPVAASAGLTMLSFSNDPSVAGNGVFLMSFLSGPDVARVVAYAASQGVRQIDALAPQSRLGDVALASAQASAQRVGAAVVGAERYPPDFPASADIVKSYAERALSRSPDGPQAVLIADQGQFLQWVASHLAFNDIASSRTQFLGVAGWNNPAILQERALHGGWFAAPDPTLVGRFAERYQAGRGTPPHPLSSIGYDAVAAAATLLKDARRSGQRYPFSPQSIAAPSGFIGANGLYRLLPNGLNERGLAVLEVGPRGFAVVDPAPTSFGGL